MKLFYLVVIVLLFNTSLTKGQDILIRQLTTSACTYLDSLANAHQFNRSDIPQQVLKHLELRTDVMMNYYEQEKTMRPELEPYKYGGEVMLKVSMQLVDSCDVYYGYYDTLLHHAVGQLSSTELSHKVDSIEHNPGPDSSFAFLIQAFMLSKLGRHTEAVISIERMIASNNAPENRILAAVLLRKQRERKAENKHREL